MKRIKQYYNTIKYLKVKQIQYQCLHRLRKIARRALRSKYSFAYYRCGIQLKLDAFIPKYESCRGEDFTFLNLTEKFDGTWENKKQGALWSFNINYMEYLLQPSMTLHDACLWINRFIEAQEGNVVGMSPYCISLRAVNWIKFVTLNRANLAPEDIKRIDTSLYSQYRILLQNMEYNLAGNHLLENLFALLWGAFYFDDNRMFDRCASELVKELGEQTLADGANYEQSPMYHCIILDRLLDAVNLLGNNRRFKGQQALYDALCKHSEKMLGWLLGIAYSDASYPLFNDSANGIAPTIPRLLDYAKRLNIKAKKGKSDASGYYCVDNERYELRMDLGGIAASYIPGHSHADTFNFELRVGGRPFIVDTGISTYQWCARRQYERSTVAHNTVVVADCNSSCVWAAFRCAQRARVFALECGKQSVKASHNGYSDRGVVHSRQFQWDEKSVTIFDTLTNDSEGKAYFHFVVSHSVVACGDSIITPVAKITFDGCNDLYIGECEISGEYNRLKRGVVAVVSFRGTLRSCIELV